MERVTERTLSLPDCALHLILSDPAKDNFLTFIGQTLYTYNYDYAHAPLGTALGRSPVMGVKTGNNGGFFLEIASVGERHVITADGLEIPFDAVCRCVRGRDIRRWRSEASTWMLWPPGGRNVSTPHWLRELAREFAAWPVVVEVRHGTWQQPQHLALFRDLGLGFANIDQPVIGRSLTPTAEATSAVGYVRFHGRNYEHWFGETEDAAQRYDYLYTAEELGPWVDRIRAIDGAQGVAEVYVVSNNHFEGKGPANALMLRSMLEGRRVRAPATLLATYPSALAPYAEADEEGRLL